LKSVNAIAQGGTQAKLSSTTRLHPALSDQSASQLLDRLDELLQSAKHGIDGEAADTNED